MSYKGWVKFLSPLIMPKPLLVDHEGVPRLVQVMRYRYANLAFRVLYFDGDQIEMDAGGVMDLMDGEPTRMQWFMAEQVAVNMWRRRRDVERSTEGKAAPDSLPDD